MGGGQASTGLRGGFASAASQGENGGSQDQSGDGHSRRACWYIGYVDHQEKRRSERGFTDRSETERLAVKLEEEARLIREGLKEPLLDALADSKRLPPKIFLRFWHLRNRDVTEKQVGETGSPQPFVTIY